MFTHFIYKVIDFILERIKGRIPSNKKKLDEVITPIFDQFQIVHDNYIDAFKKIRSMATKENCELKEISELIKSELIFSDDKRTKLKALASLNTENSIEFQMFIGSIREYLGNLDISQMPFQQSFFKGLTRLITISNSQTENTNKMYTNFLMNNFGTKNKNDHCGIILAAVDEVFLDIQRQYKTITKEYFNCKSTYS